MKDVLLGSDDCSQQQLES